MASTSKAVDNSKHQAGSAMVIFPHTKTTATLGVDSTSVLPEESQVDNGFFAAGKEHQHFPTTRKQVQRHVQFRVRDDSGSSNDERRRNLRRALRSLNDSTKHAENATPGHYQRPTSSGFDTDTSIRATASPGHQPPPPGSAGVASTEPFVDPWQPSRSGFNRSGPLPAGPSRFSNRRYYLPRHELPTHYMPPPVPPRPQMGAYPPPNYFPVPVYAGFADHLMPFDSRPGYFPVPVYAGYADHLMPFDSRPGYFPAPLYAGYTDPLMPSHTRPGTPSGARQPATADPGDDNYAPKPSVIRPRSRASNVRKERDRMPSPKRVSRRPVPPTWRVTLPPTSRLPQPSHPRPPAPQQTAPSRPASHSRQYPPAPPDDSSLPLFPEDYGYYQHGLDHEHFQPLYPSPPYYQYYHHGPEGPLPHDQTYRVINRTPIGRSSGGVPREASRNIIADCPNEDFYYATPTVRRNMPNYRWYEDVVTGGSQTPLTAEVLRDASRNPPGSRSTLNSYTTSGSDHHRSHDTDITSPSTGSGAGHIKVTVQGIVLSVPAGSEITLSSDQQPPARAGGRPKTGYQAKRMKTDGGRRDSRMVMRSHDDYNDADDEEENEDVANDRYHDNDNYDDYYNDYRNDKYNDTDSHVKPKIKATTNASGSRNVASPLTYAKLKRGLIDKNEKGLESPSPGRPQSRTVYQNWVKDPVSDSGSDRANESSRKSSQLLLTESSALNRHASVADEENVRDLDWGDLVVYRPQEPVLPDVSAPIAVSKPEMTTTETPTPTEEPQEVHVEVWAPREPAGCFPCRLDGLQRDETIPTYACCSSRRKSEPQGNASLWKAAQRCSTEPQLCFPTSSPLQKQPGLTREDLFLLYLHKTHNLRQEEMESIHITPNQMKKVRQAMTTDFSRDFSPGCSSVLVGIRWRLRHFLRRQFAGVASGTAPFRSIVTVTGSDTDAQALTVGEYLSQTWPSVANKVLQLLPASLDPTLDHTRVRKALVAPGTVAAVLYGEDAVLLRVTGNQEYLVQVVQSFVWIAGALRAGPAMTGAWECTPLFTRSKALKGQPRDTECFIAEFFMRQLQSTMQPGCCWQRMFNGAVRVAGFPIQRRSMTGMGLEMPLSMMAKMAGSPRVTEWNNRIFIKGYSTMLVAIKSVSDCLVWHYYHGKPGQRLSYMDCSQEAEAFDTSRLAQVRHVIGWCSASKYCTGSSEANFNVRGTHLPRPSAGFLLEKVSISMGKIISGAATFTPGVKELPQHLSRSGTISKLRWLSRKYVVLWDEQDKRGWLVNGTSALLHIVRASLHKSEKDDFSSSFIFDKTKMYNLEECDRYKANTANKVLADNSNRQLRIYLDRAMQTQEMTTNDGCSTNIQKRGYFMFGDLVDQHLSALEQIIDHHDHRAGRNGMKLKGRLRTHLEGWDFVDLATDDDPIPRVATVPTFRHGWVDFIRSIGAITLFGRGFGDLMQPAVAATAGLCPRWRRLPTQAYLLAASVTDLKCIMEKHGNPHSVPRELVHKIEWHSPADTCVTCPCQLPAPRQSSEACHVDPVQVLLPRSTTSVSRRRAQDRTAGAAPEFTPEAAVVFGYNAAMGLGWPVNGTSEVPLKNGLPVRLFPGTAAAAADVAHASGSDAESARRSDSDDVTLSQEPSTSVTQMSVGEDSTGSVELAESLPLPPPPTTRLTTLTTLTTWTPRLSMLKFIPKRRKQGVLGTSKPSKRRAKVLQINS